MAVQERRKMVRRQTDREMIKRFQAMGAEGESPESRELRHLRRRAIRHHCQVHIAIKVSHASASDDVWTVDEFKVKGRILDLSAEGCSLFTLQQLDIGQELNLIIELQNGKRIRACGVIRWTKRVTDRNGFASGVQFTHIQPGDQRLVLAFLEELDRTIGL